MRNFKRLKPGTIQALCGQRLFARSPPDGGRAPAELPGSSGQDALFMTDTNYQPIDCGLHDKLELACMRAYAVRVITDTDVLTGIPVTTRTTADHAEWLVISQRDGERDVRLDRIRSLEPLDDRAGYARIDLKSP
jgi:Rho-binding antiterminator